MNDEMTLSDWNRFHEELLKTVEENRQAFELAVLLHDQGVVTDKTKENVLKASVLAFVMDLIKPYPPDDNAKAENV